MSTHEQIVEALSSAIRDHCDDDGDIRRTDLIVEAGMRLYDVSVPLIIEVIDDLIRMGFMRQFRDAIEGDLYVQADRGL